MLLALIDFLRNLFFSLACVGAQLARPSDILKHNLVLSSVAHRMLKTSYVGSLLCVFVHTSSFDLDLTAFQRPDPEIQSFAQNLVKGVEKAQGNTKEIADTVPKIPNWLVTLEERSQRLRFRSPTDEDEALGLHAEAHLVRPKHAVPSEFYIFASLGLRQKHLKALLEDAKRFKGVIVVRGLKNNSFQETIAYLQSVLKKEHEGIQIDPTLFRKYNISSVPAFVLSNGDSFDVLRGNVTARFALSRMQAQGDLALEAKQRLSHAK